MPSDFHFVTRRGAPDADSDLLASAAIGSDDIIDMVAGAKNANSYSQASPGFFGDGFDGTTTLAAGTTTLSKDMTYENLTVPSGATVNSHGYRIFVRNTLTINSGGKIQCNGGAGNANGTAGIASTVGTLFGGQAAGAGNTGAGSNSGANVANSYGGASGAGGTGSSGGGIARTTVAPADGSARHLPNAILGHVATQSAGAVTWTALGGGAGGGGGGGDGSVKGGGGGGGGGIVVVSARNIVNNGLIWAVGGQGGSPATGNSGGGGGGGGGTIVLNYETYKGSGSTQVYGGVGGTGSGTGTNGGEGSAGTVIKLRSRVPYLLAGELHVRYTKANITPLTTEPNHRAFGNVVTLPNGNQMAVWRTGNQHGPASPGGAGTDQGVLSQAFSTDGGLTWGAITDFYTDATYNCQDLCAMVTRAGTVLVSFFMTDTDGTDHLNGCRVIRSTDNGVTWDTPRALNDSLTTWSALSSPAVQLSTGTLVQAVYGVKAGVSADKAQVVFSRDDGVTWGSPVDLPNLGASATDEPNLVYVAGNLLVCMMRQSSDSSMGRCVSTDGGLTWSALTTVIPGSQIVTGSPRTVRCANGTFVLLCRTNIAGGSSRQALFTSVDKGVTWSAPYDLEEATQIKGTYGGMVETSPGTLCVVYGYEHTTNYLDSTFNAKQVFVGPA